MAAGLNSTTPQVPVSAAIRVLRRRIVGRLVVREYELRRQRLLAGEEIASNVMERLSVAPVIDVPPWIG
jgi:hypothetical protein